MTRSMRITASIAAAAMLIVAYGPAWAAAPNRPAKVNAPAATARQAGNGDAVGTGPRAKAYTDTVGVNRAGTAAEGLQQGPQPRSGVLQEAEFVDTSVYVRAAPGTAGGSPTTTQQR